MPYYFTKNEKPRLIVYQTTRHIYDRHHAQPLILSRTLRHTYTHTHSHTHRNAHTHTIQHCRRHRHSFVVVAGVVSMTLLFIVCAFYTSSMIPFVVQCVRLKQPTIASTTNKINWKREERKGEREREASATGRLFCRWTNTLHTRRRGVNRVFGFLFAGS